MHKFLDNHFGQAEEINGDHRCPTYMYRWVMAQGQKWKAYLHKIVGDDWSRDRHDHPKRFISIGLWGSYLEETPSGLKRFRAPWIRSFPAEYQHRLSTPWGTCWTLCIVLETVREWGFWHEGKWIHWRDYVDGVDGIADKMTACK